MPDRPPTTSHRRGPVPAPSGLAAALIVLLACAPGCDNDGGIQTVNSPPAASIQQPPGESLPFVEGTPITFVGTALDQGAAPGELEVTWTSNADGVLNTDPPDSDGIVEFTTNELSTTTHIVTLEVVDVGGLSSEDTVTVTVVAESDRDDDADGYTPNEGDCNDGDNTIYPGAPEQPNGVDDDCDGTIDEGTHLYDDDGDGWTEQDGDCDDDDDDTYPDAPELADQIDNDCDGAVDEGTVIYDDDGDGYTEAEGDCDDADASTFPTATESGDGIDNDCDGVIDEDTAVRDDDGDCFCESVAAPCTGSANAGCTVLEGGDCDDSDPTAAPDQTESCNGQDDDCDGDVDEEDADGCTSYYYDYDGDTYGVGDPSCLCGPTGSYTSIQAGDCYDLNYDVKPGQTNWFTTQRGDNSFDYNCDGSEELQYTDGADYACPGVDSQFCDMLAQWYDSVPDCGVAGDWITDCTFHVYGGCGWFCCTFDETSITQACR